MVLTDATREDYPIIYCNPGFERLTGYMADEVIGRNCRFLQGPDTDRGELAKLRAAVMANKPHSVVLRNYRKDRTPFWNALSVTPLADADGRVTHFVGVQTDITAAKDLEAQFFQAQKMELVGRLTGAVAHDFNNLLTVIGGFTEAALDALGPGHPVRALLEEVAAAGQRAAGLTRQLLSFSRKGSGRNARCDLSASVAGCEGMLRRLVGSGIELVVSLDPQTGLVGLDTGRVEQVVMNLAVNARDAMPSGGKLVISTRGEVVEGGGDIPAGQYALLRVADTGQGMNAETRARIFEPFFTTKSAGHGTGLGLSTVMDIVRAAEGHIRVWSEPGWGTEFWVYLPRVSPPAADAILDTSGEYRIRGSEVVLVVDDDTAVRAVMSLSLRARGYTVLEASGAEAARAAVRDHPGPIHLAAIDEQLPVISGMALAAELRLERPEIQVLLVSGYASEKILEIDGQEAHYLAKPFTSAELAGKVRWVLDHS